MLGAMDKDIIPDFVGLSGTSDSEAPATPEGDTIVNAESLDALTRQTDCSPVPRASTTGVSPVPGVPARLQDPSSAPLDDVVSGLFAGENGDLSSDFVAALEDCPGGKLDNPKLGSVSDGLEIYNQSGCEQDVAMGEATENVDENGTDFFEMASFLGESEDTKQTFGGAGFDGGSDGQMMWDLGMSELPPGVQAPGAANMPEASSVVDNSGGPVAMGIPYYVACQWQMQQQQQQQQQQAAVMLWWQAYLSSCGGMFGNPGALPPSFPTGWGMPPPGLQLPGGMFPPAPGADALFPQLMNAGMASALGGKANAGGQAQGAPAKRRRRTDSSSGSGGGDGNADLSNVNSPSRKGRRPRQEERVCKNCSTVSTPFWRKDKHDGLPLCNACGLYLSKNDAPRPKVLWKSSDAQPVTVAEANNTTCL